MLIISLTFIFALFLAWFITPIMRRIAIKNNILVNPGGRRIHTRPTPQWGGLAIYAGFAISSIVFLLLTKNFSVSAIGLIVSGAIIVTMGMLDDVHELSPIAQSIYIVIAAIVAISFGIRIQFLTNPFSEMKIVHLPIYISWPLTIIWIFGVTKPVDFMDGLDGLASGIGAIAASTLGIMAYYSGQHNVAIMAIALSGACIGFLRFNFNPAKIFMGTGGSQFIGFALAIISIIGAFKVAAAMAIVIPILVLGIPIFDGLFVMLRRLAKGQSISSADKSHIHHRLLKLGLSQKQAVLVIWALMAVLCAIAIFILFHQ